MESPHTARRQNFDTPPPTVRGLEARKGDFAYSSLPRTRMFDDSINSAHTLLPLAAGTVESFMQHQELHRVVLDTAGSILAVSTAFAEVMGRSAEDMVGRPFWDFIDLDSLDQAMAVLDRLALHRGVDAFVSCFRDSQGKRVWLEWSCPGAGADNLLYASAKLLGCPPAGSKHVVGVRGFDADVI